MKRFPIALAVAAFTLVSASGAFAEGIKIDGTVTQNVNADKNTNTALGQDSVARQVFGVINADVSSGTVEQNINANENTNLAEGQGSEACQAFGVIGSVEDVCGARP